MILSLNHAYKRHRTHHSFFLHAYSEYCHGKLQGLAEKLQGFSKADYQNTPFYKRK